MWHFSCYFEVTAIASTCRAAYNVHHFLFSTVFEQHHDQQRDVKPFKASVDNSVQEIFNSKRKKKIVEVNSIIPL